MTPAPHEAAPASTDQTVTTSAVAGASSANGGASAPAPTGTVGGPQNGTSDLTARLATIRATAEDLTDLCPEYLRQGIRHLQRNCDIECNAHGDEDPWLGCNQPGRYDGDRMAEALASIPRLLAAVEGVLGLHKPETRWMPYDGADVSYATREEAIEACEDLDIGIAATVLVPFDLCTHCKIIEEAPCEGECTKEAGYRESLWPCPTIQALTAAIEGVGG